MNKNLKIYILCILLSSISFLTLLPYFDNFENNLQDKRFRKKYATSDRTNTIPNIVIVDIDARSIKKIGKYHGWKRDHFAKTVDALNGYKTAVVGFDILLDNSQNLDDDTLLAQSLENSNFVILGYNFNNPDLDNFSYPDSTLDTRLRVNQESIVDSIFYAPTAEILDIGSASLHNLAVGSGFVNMNPDDDGVVRKAHLFYRYLDRLYPSLDLKMCLKYLDVKIADINLVNGKQIILKNALLDSVRQDLTIPLNEDNSLTIHYTGPWKSCRPISFYDVMEDRVGRKTFKDKIALVGASLPGLYDLKTTPVAEKLPGVEVHGNIINTILSQNFIKTTSKEFTALSMLFSIVFISLFFLGKIRTTVSAVVVLIYAAGYVWISFYLFNRHSIIVDQFHVLVAMITVSLFAYLIKYFMEEKDKKFIKNTLGKYVPEVVSNAMLKDSSKLKLGGERKEITMFFSDIRDFTKISEKVSPEILVKFLNIYLSRMTKIIKNNQGTLDKFMGDAIICFFGAPLENDHTYNACKTALEVIRELDVMRPTMIDEVFKTVQIGIGINTGEVTVGNIGSMELFDYTAIGDNMNLASRLEGLNKYYGTTILISDNTFDKVRDRFIAREIDRVIVKGRSVPVTLYELLAIKDDSNEKLVQYRKIETDYENGLNAYRCGDFLAAISLLEKAELANPNDKPVKLLLERSRNLLINTPDDWQGVWVMVDK